MLVLWKVRNKSSTFLLGIKPRRKVLDKLTTRRVLVNEYSKQLIATYCGNLIGLRRYLIPLILELSLSDDQINAFFKANELRRVDLWIKISNFINDNKIENRTEGVKQFITETLKRTQYPVA